MAEWQDIHITDLDEQRSARIEPVSAMWRFYFTLSAQAPTAWQQIFKKGREFPRHSLWRKAKATNRHIVLEAPLDEIERHKSDLDEDMAYTNAAYRKHLEAVHQQKMREEEEAQDDHSLLHDLRQKLFDDSA